MARVTVRAPGSRTASVQNRAVGAGVLLAAAVGAGLVVGLGGDGLIGLGLPDPGLLTRAGLPFLRVLAECSAVITVGSLLLAAFLVPPHASGHLNAGGYAAMRTSRIAALSWMLTAALLVPLSAADALGRPVANVLDPRLLASLVSQLSQPGAWACTALLALVLAGFSWHARTWGAAVWLLALSLAGLAPVALTGHSSAGGAHDIALSSLLYHVVAAALWIGGLVAVLAHLARGGEHAGLACARFSRLALVCWIVMAASGVLNALIRVTPGRLLTTYGLLVAGKVIALLILGGLGWLHRRGTVAAVVERGDRSAILRWGGVEILVMFATIGLAVALSQTAPPGGIAARPSPTEALLGYDLAGPPTVARLLLDWRPDLVLGVGALVLAGFYLAGVRRLVLRGHAWPLRRTAAWLSGCAVILIATSSGIGRYSMAMFSMHLAVHLLLSVLAPVLLVLGGPVTLGLAALPPAGAGNLPGPREWLVVFTRSWVVRMSTHPWMALVMYAASFLMMYSTGLFDAVASSHWMHLVMNTHSLLMGYPYYWLIIGIDPVPHRFPHRGKLGLLLAVMPLFAFSGISLLSSSTVAGGDFYRSLALPFMPDLLADQHTAGAMVWTLGEIPIALVLVALLVQPRIRVRSTCTFQGNKESNASR
jgi:cytochrome c oxidase assembly factor CtaG/putative copper export protein